MNDETKTMLMFVPVGGALGALVGRLITGMADATTRKVSISKVLSETIGFTVTEVFVAAVITLVAAILLDLNKQNRWRIFATAFLLGIVWPGVWARLVVLAQDVGQLSGAS